MLKNTQHLSQSILIPHKSRKAVRSTRICETRLVEFDDVFHQDYNSHSKKLCLISLQKYVTSIFFVRWKLNSVDILV